MPGLCCLSNAGSTGCRLFMALRPPETARRSLASIVAASAALMYKTPFSALRMMITLTCSTIALSSWSSPSCFFVRRIELVCFCCAEVKGMFPYNKQKNK